jgi:ferric-dicitrate binding protein FerR (iron transport regulator)
LLPRHRLGGAWAEVPTPALTPRGSANSEPFQLADGSAVELNALSSAEFHLTTHQRDVTLLEGRAETYDESGGASAEEVNRYSRRPLTISDPELQKIKISGVYSSTDPASLINFLRNHAVIQVIETKKRVRIVRRDTH